MTYEWMLSKPIGCDIMDNTRVFNCTMELTLDIIGGKWKPLIIFHIGNNEKLRYGEIGRLIPDISKRVLSRELKELETNGIISREEFRERVLRLSKDKISYYFSFRCY